jgi:hypothetical protein
MASAAGRFSKRVIISYIIDWIIIMQVSHPFDRFVALWLINLQSHCCSRRCIFCCHSQQASFRCHGSRYFLSLCCKRKGLNGSSYCHRPGPTSCDHICGLHVPGTGANYRQGCFGLESVETQALGMECVLDGPWSVSSRCVPDRQRHQKCSWETATGPSC